MSKARKGSVSTINPPDACQIKMNKKAKLQEATTKYANSTENTKPKKPHFCYEAQPSHDRKDCVAKNAKCFK